MNTRVCKKCGIEKTLGLFSKSTPKTGKNTQCKACVAARKQASRLANPEHTRAVANAYLSAKMRKPGYAYSKKARHKSNNTGLHAVKQFAEKMKNRKAFVQWADRKAMSVIYAVALARRVGGEDVTVDHVIPLNHPLVCGLHNEFNLQYLTFDENVAKSNSFEID